MNFLLYVQGLFVVMNEPQELDEPLCPEFVDVQHAMQEAKQQLAQLKQQAHTVAQEMQRLQEIEGALRQEKLRTAALEQQLLAAQERAKQSAYYVPKSPHDIEKQLHNVKEIIPAVQR